jgi:hypothetical protein
MSISYNVLPSHTPNRDRNGAEAGLRTSWSTGQPAVQPGYAPSIVAEAYRSHGGLCLNTGR